MDIADERDPCCCGCKSLLTEPFIQCASCTQADTRTDTPPDTRVDTPDKVTICLHCFAKGVEFDQHKNDHSYYVVVSKNVAWINMVKCRAPDKVHIFNSEISIS